MRKDPAVTPARLALISAMPLALATLHLAPLAAQDADSSDVETGTEATPAPTEGEKRLARLLEGRVAGEPLRCIRSLPSQRMQTIEGTAYVYGSGETIYVQRTVNPRQIDDTDTLVTNRFSGTQLCRFDVMTTVDRFNGFFTGAVFFEDFVPYTRVKSEATGEG
ncbi:MAG: hypothetical protein EAY70_04380 [Sphingomonadales bacterium]|nr:MAG: hypothetical protein EAY70_04380 [Sphingomonadales bacterium]